jgi:endonuclease-3
MPRARLPAILDALEAVHGAPPAPRRDPFELVLLENVAYLVSDEKREAAFAALRRKVGTNAGEDPGRPSRRPLRRGRARRHAPGTARGEAPRHRGDRARLGDLRTIVRRPPAEAKKALQRFPRIGLPGAEKILLFAGALEVLALESNGLRVLVRLGYGEEKKGYAATYKTAQAAAEPELDGTGSAGLVRAHLLLRRHGQELCKTNRPRCDVCPVRARCPYPGRQAAKIVAPRG